MGTLYGDEDMFFCGFRVSVCVIFHVGFLGVGLAGFTLAFNFVLVRVPPLVGYDIEDLL